MRRATSGQGTGMHHQEENTRHHKEGLTRLWPYAPPWCIWLGMLLIANVGRHFWGGSPWYSAGCEAAAIGGIWLVARMTKTLHEVLRMLAICTTIVVWGFVFMVGILGMTTVLWSLWGGVGFVVCAYWTMRRMLLPAYEHGQRAASPMAQKLIDAMGGATLGNPKRMTIEGLPGQTALDDEAAPIRVPMTVNRGEQTLDELKHIPETLETIGKLRPGAVRLEHDRTDRGKTTVVINPVDLLEGMVPWRGPSAFGESISLPVPVGRYASTKLSRIFMVGDEAEGRNLVQWLIMGMTGAGKSAFMRMLAADLSTRRFVTIWAHDHVKGLQTLKPLIEGGALDWVTMTKDDGKKMLAVTKLVIQARARWLGMKGFDQWEDGCGLNVLIVWLEEANALAQMKDLLDLVREGRSVGVIIMVSVQRASHTTMDTDTRAQLAGNICFGVESDQDAKFGLPDHVIDAGASPERWRADMPGYCYIAAPGIPQEQQAEELRGFIATKDQVRDAALRGQAIRTPLTEEIDHVTIKAAGNAYMKRVPPEAFLDPQHPLFAKGMGMTITVGGNNTTDGETMDDDKPKAVGNSGAEGAEYEERDDDDDDISTTEQEEKLEAPVDIPECPDPEMQNEHPRQYQNLTTDQCRESVQQYLRAIDAEGKAFVTVPDILKMRPPIRRGREWIRSELKRLADEIEDQTPSPEGFRLERVEDAGVDAGTFRIVPPVVNVGEPVGAQLNGRREGLG